MIYKLNNKEKAMINDQNIAEKKEKILRILRENMYVATGCTEPELKN